MSWEVKSLDSLCDEITVGFVGSMATEYKSNGITFLRSLNIEPFKLNLNPSQLKFISEDFHSKIKKSKLNGGDLAIVRTGLPGTCCVIPNDFGEVNCSDLVIARPKKNVNPFYLCYFINSPLGMGTIGGSLVGVAQKHFNVSVAKRMEIPIPNLITQNRIASILSAYDDLIENNLKRIKLLEETAQNIYKEWFVYFRFPNYEHTEFDTESGLPVGWEMKTLNDVIEFKVDNRGRNPEYYSEKGIPVIDNFLLKDSISVNLSNCKRYIDETIFESFIRKYLEPNDVLITLVGNLGSISLAPQTKTVIIQNTIGLRCNNLCSQFFLYCFLLNSKTKIQNMNRGVAQPSVLVGDLFNLQIALPKINYINDFSSIIEPVFNMVNTLTLQNQNLKEARDILLPRLMNRTIEL